MRSHVRWIVSVKPLPHICGRPWVNKSVEWQQSMQPSGNLQWSEMKPMGKCIKNSGSLSIYSRLRIPFSCFVKILVFTAEWYTCTTWKRKAHYNTQTHLQRSVFMFITHLLLLHESLEVCVLFHNWTHDWFDWQVAAVCQEAKPQLHLFGLRLAKSLVESVHQHGNHLHFGV